MKVAVSIPDELFQSAEKVSRKLGLPRSRFYAAALADYVGKHQGRKVTERLDAAYAAEESRLDAGIRRAQKRSLSSESW